MFLKILGVIFLLLLLVLAVVGWRVYRAIKGRMDSDMPLALSVLPPLGMELQPSSVEGWKDKARLSQAEERLRRVGATLDGYFTFVHGMAQIRVALWNFKQQAVVAFYEAAASDSPEHVTFIQEVACRLTDGSLCITSNANALYDARPDNHRLVYNGAEDVLELLKALRGAMPEGARLLKIPDARSFFTECCEDAFEWGWRKEQLTSEKTRQQLTSVGVKVNDKLLQELEGYGREFSVEVAVNQARRKLASRPDISAAQWEKLRDRLVFINARMQIDSLVDAIYALGGELDERQQQVLDGFCLTARELVDPFAAFHMLVQSMDLKVKRIARMESPVKTEVYLPV